MQGLMRSWLRASFFLIIILHLSVDPARANLQACGDCICIEWSLDTGIYIEVRCTEASGGGADGGWALTPPPTGSVPDNGGSFGGNTNLNPYSSPPPGTSVPSGPKTDKLNSAKSSAGSKLALNCHKDPVDQQIKCWETTCTSLFANNRTHMPGSQIFGSAVFRYGQNFSYLADGVTRTPCQETNAPIAFVRAINDRYIFLCDTFFGFAPPTASLLLIHELLHVAGQREDLNGVAGPNNPPSSDAIQDEVENACTSPADVGNGY